jgi:putative phosphoribosyl transferase
MRFRDRSDAGRRLAEALAGYRDQAPVVLALPRGGVPVAAEVAAALGAPLDVLLVRKIGVPFEPELAMGAVAEGTPPVIVRNERVIRAARVAEADFDAVRAREEAEIVRRQRLYRPGRPPPAVAGRTVILIDDGIATGATAEAALRALRARGAKTLVLAVPVAAAESLESLRRFADATVCVESPESLDAIGFWYDDFHQVPDREVIALLSRFSG